MPLRSPGYQVVPTTSDATLYDGNTATGNVIDVTTGSPHVAEQTAMVDLGASPTAVKFIKAAIGFSGAVTDSVTKLVEYSNDLVTWTAPPFSSFTASNPNACNDFTQNTTCTLTTATSARYWRYSLRNTVAGCAHARAAFYEIEAQDAGGAHIAEYSPPPPPDLNASSSQVALVLVQPLPGTVTRSNSATSTPVALTLSGGGGSVSNAGNLSVSSRPVRLAVADLADAGAGAQMTGNLKFSMCRDNRGARWSAEVAVANNVDVNSCGVAWLGNRWGCLYTIQRQAYWKTTADPEDWSAAAAVIPGVTGQVLGLARNQVGALCAMLGTTPVVSRNGGLTWQQMAAVAGATTPLSIVAKNHYFVIACPSGSTVRHFVSRDGGETFQ